MQQKEYICSFLKKGMYQEKWVTQVNKVEELGMHLVTYPKNMAWWDFISFTSYFLYKVFWIASSWKYLFQQTLHYMFFF